MQAIAPKICVLFSGIADHLSIRGLLAKYHRALTIWQNAVLNMAAHRAGEHQRLHIAAHVREVLNAHGMIYPLNILLNDRSFVEVFSHIVRRRTDDFNAARVRLVIGTGAFKAR